MPNLIRHPLDSASHAGAVAAIPRQAIWMLAWRRTSGKRGLGESPGPPIKKPDQKIVGFIFNKRTLFSL